MNKLLLLDGHSLIFRAYYAISDSMVTTNGYPTNATYGFLSMLTNLVRDQSPTHVGVAFDRSEPTFRHELVDDYKGGRKETPETLLPQFEFVQEILEAFDIPAISLAGFEADDVIATLASRASSRGDQVVVISGDRDTFQLVEDPFIQVLYNKRGVSEYELYDEDGIFKRSGVTPRQYVNYAALRGDVSDNLPGVSGVGEKTAAKLINTFGDIDGIYANLDVHSTKLRESLLEARDRVYSNIELMTLKRDLPIDLGKNDEGLIFGTWNRSRAVSLLDKFEFRALKTRLFTTFDSFSNQATATPIESSKSTAIPTTSAKSATTSGDFQALLERYSTRFVFENSELELTVNYSDKEKNEVAVESIWIDKPGRSELAMQIVAMRPTGEGSNEIRILVLDASSQLGQVNPAPNVSRNKISDILVDSLLVGYDLKPFLRWFYSNFDTELNPSFDTLLAGFLLDENTGDSGIKGLARKFLGLDWESALEVLYTTKLWGECVSNLNISESKKIELANCLCGVVLAFDLRDELKSRMENVGISQLFEDIEIPLLKILSKMEATGVHVDGKKLLKLQDDLIERADALKEEIFDFIGHEFNLNSPLQLGKVLFEELQLPTGKKTKTGYSTDARTLEGLKQASPIVSQILGFREVEKLRSTFCVGLLNEINSEDSRIHASFSQVIARTGRISSDQPNLHNIPIRSQLGARFREVFTAPPGSVILAADYDQIELRILAHLCKDPALLAAFKEESDIHSFTASRIFGIDIVKVTPEQRSKAKMVGYGLSYGMEAFGLASRLGISIGEATEILNGFFASFPKVKSFMDETILRAKTNGFTETEFGRRRHLPDLHAANRQIRLAAERQAMNAPIQGLAADIFKVALVNLDRTLMKKSLNSTIVLQVHDEIVLEVGKPELDEVQAIVESEMTSAYQLSVDLKVHIGWGDSWSSAKSN